MAPRIEGEELALRNAYAEAGVSPRTVGLVEAHGTATAVGDVVEVQALTRVFGQREGELPTCALGTVKSMISHTIPASGVAGVIKLALALYHRVLPPTLNVSEPNPKLELEKTPFYINTETRPWIQGGPEPRRAGINAFGFGGINAHAVLEEMPAALPLDHLPPWDSEVFVLQGDSPAALVEQATSLRRRLEAGSPSFTLADLAYTLNCGPERAENAVRLAIVAESFEDLGAKLQRASEKLAQPDCRRIKDISGIYYEAEPLGREGKVVLMFPGEGAQYPGMLADLCLHFPEVREAFDLIDRMYRDHPRGYVTSDWVYPRPAFSNAERLDAEARLMRIDVAVEAVLTANGAIHGILRRLGLRPDACVGHSTGEYSAAAAAGVLLIDTEERFIAFGAAMDRCYSAAASRDDVPRAVLLAVGADRERVAEIADEAGGDIFVAMDNCPHQAVLVGDREAAERAREILRREGLIYSELPYDRAVHTPLFARFADDLRDVFAQIGVGCANSTVYSCTTVAPYPADEDGVRELFVEHWTRPVEFRRTIERLYDEGARVFVEAGPRANLTGFLDDILRGRPYCAVPADLQRRTGTAQLNHLVGILAAHEVDLDLGYLYAHRQVRAVTWADAAQSHAPTRGGSDVSLALSWPMLRLPDDAVARVRRVAVAGANGDSPAPPPRRLAAQGPGAEHAGAAATGLPAPSVGGALAQVDELERVMDTHLATMARFLSAQEEIMQQFLAETALDGLLHEAGAPRTAPSVGPLVGTAVTWTPGELLVARRVFDPEVDVYLRHHALGRGISLTDPSLDALMVMPLTMSLEILAEAASALVPGFPVTGLRDVHAHHWLAWEGEPRTLEVTARRLPGSAAEERVHVKLAEPVSNGDDGKPPAVEGVVLLAETYPEAPAGRELKLHDGRASRWTPGSLYADEMFHGPCWQGVRSVTQTGSRGAIAELEVLPFAGMLAGAAEPRFALDPVVLDAAGQLIGFWTAERLERGKVIFPFRLEALDVYGPQRPTGETLTCAAEIELIGEQVVSSEIDVLRPDGRLWLRLEGWEDKRFDVPVPFRPLTRVADRTPLSADWPKPVEPLRAGPVLCRRLETASLPDRGLWKSVWAHRVLGRAERAELRALTLPEPRVLEWLGARTAAKEAVLELVRMQYGLELLPADVEIRKDDLGRPVAGGRWLGDVPVPPVVSLAHTGSTAVALVAPDGRVGIDVELLRSREPGFAQVAFALRERELLDTLPAEQAEEWTLRCWCAKEAVGKALGTGLSHGPQGLSVTAIDTDGRISIELGVEMAREHKGVAGLPIVVYTYREDDLIVATTRCDQGGLD
jgi:malonyl CoA-acyl carrier protein transacylase/phosphopantetheinyl transferase